MIGVILTGSLASVAQAQDPPPDLTELDLEELMQLDIIPIDVMGSHIHLAGDFMVGYRYMNMNEGRSHGGSTTDFGGFMVQPTSMRMQMHMVEAMYGVTNDFTLMVMLPYKRLSMDHVTLKGDPFTGSHDGRTLAREFQCDGPADAACRAGHDRGLAVETHGGSFPLYRPIALDLGAVHDAA